MERLSVRLIIITLSAAYSVETADTAMSTEIQLSRNSQFLDTDAFILSTLHDITVESCKRECKSRPKCVAAEYRHLLKYCKLFSAIPTSSDSSPGSLTMTNFIPKEACGDALCGQSEVCNTTSGQCEVRECGIPASVFELKGNVFTVGAKIVNGHQQMMCAETGMWKLIRSFGDKPTTCSDVNGLEDTYMYINDVAIKVHCDFETDGGDWLIFQKRQDGSVDFHLGWEDYKTGFGTDREVWLGLENMYHVVRSSPTGYELRIEMEDWDGVKKFAVYDKFELHGEDDGYRMNLGTYTGNAGNMLQKKEWPADGHMFSTKDRDNDLHKFSCVKLFHGAWWYSACHASNLNGRYYDGGEATEQMAGLFWREWTGIWKSLKKTVMMIREK